MSMERLGIVGILIAGVALGAFREFLFINLNYQIDLYENHRLVSYAHSMFRGWVEGWDLPALVRLKWVLACAFILIMLGLSITLARLLFGDHRYMRTIAAGFAVVGALALVMHGLAGAVPPFKGVSIKLLHLLQYPVVLIFLWAASALGRSRT